MDLEARALDQIRVSVKPSVSTTDLTVTAFNGAVWAETRCCELDIDREATEFGTGSEIRRMAAYRDACLTLVASATGIPSHFWLDKVRAIADEKVPA